jgi:cystathionine beta-lyase
VIDSSGTNAVKLEQMREQFGRSDLLGMWVADMDFATPPFVLEALRRRLSHPILGYSVVPDEFWPTVARWIQEHHGWKVETDWMRYVPGIVKGIGMAVNVFTSAGDKVIVQPPVYHPFRLVPEGNGRQVVWNPLRRCEDGTYEMDFDQLERVWTSAANFLSSRIRTILQASAGTLTRCAAWPTSAPSGTWWW